MTTPGVDAAFAKNIQTNSTDVVGGYLNSANAFHPWTVSDWGMFPKNPKLPYWVAGHSVRTEAKECVRQLRALGVPKGSSVGLDLETRVNVRYCELFFDRVRGAGYKVLVYGSVGNVFQNPSLNGYIVADYDDNPDFLPTWNDRAVRAKQYKTGELIDSNTWRTWVADALWH